MAQDSDDEWLDMHIAKYAENEEELTEASARQRARTFLMEALTEMECGRQFRFPMQIASATAYRFVFESSLLD